MTSNIILAGFGGQGILFAGKLLAYAGLMDEKEVSWLPSYGPEMRGGTANCSVVISDVEISSPLILEPDELIVMNSPSFEKFINAVKPGGKVFVDSTMIEEKSDRTDIDCYYIPATDLAAQNDLKGMANIILIGKLLKETGLTTMDVVKKGISKVVPPTKAQLIDLNLKAIQLGMEY